jgi:hypothetical protein
MAPTRPTVVTDSLARGVRRHKDQMFDDVLGGRTRESLPEVKSFRGMLRAMDRTLVNLYGRGMVKNVLLEKKKGSWLFVHRREDFQSYDVGMYTAARTATQFPERHDYFPIQLTAHFVERHMQACRATAAPLVDLVEYVLKCLVGKHYEFVETFDGKVLPAWRESGSMWIASPEFLVIGETPEFGDAVLKTVIRADVLENEKRPIWEALLNTESKTSFRPLARDPQFAR